jgi:hypothetical protein
MNFHVDPNVLSSIAQGADEEIDSTDQTELGDAARKVKDDLILALQCGSQFMVVQDWFEDDPKFHSIRDNYHQVLNASWTQLEDHDDFWLREHFCNMCVTVAAVHEFVAMEAAGDNEDSQNIPQGRKLKNKSIDLRLAIWSWVSINGLRMFDSGL